MEVRIKEKIEEILKNNIKTMVVSVVALLIVVVAIVGSVTLFSDNISLAKEESVKERIEKLARDFYEEKYYPTLVNKNGDKENVKKYKNDGITIDLTNLIRVYGSKDKDLAREFANDNKGYVCNYDNTKVIILPKEPYEATSYDLEVILDCDFQEKK